MIHDTCYFWIWYDTSNMIFVIWYLQLITISLKIVTHYLLPYVCMSDTRKWYYYVYTIQCLRNILYLLPDNWYFLFETSHNPYFLYVTHYLLIIVTCRYAKYDVFDQLLDITCKEIDSSRPYSATRSCFFTSPKGTC